MPLSTKEKEAIRYHLGYLNVTVASSLSFGQPLPRQTLFLVDSAMLNVSETTLPRIRQHLKILVKIECKLVEALDRFAAKKLGNLELREDETELLEREYVRWGLRLADNLGVPTYLFSARYKEAGGVMAGNIPTRN